MTHIEILCAIAQVLKDPRYLEIGVGDGGCFSRVARHCQSAIAVDVVSNPYGDVRETILSYEHAEFFDCGSDTFFDHHAEGRSFDLVFIDGSHWAEQVRRDWKNVLTVLAPLGMVALHDSWSPTEDLAGQGSDTAWQVAAEIENDPAFEAFTLPRRPGLTLARPRVPRFQ